MQLNIIIFWAAKKQLFCFFELGDSNGFGEEIYIQEKLSQYLFTHHP